MRFEGRGNSSQDFMNCALKENVLLDDRKWRESFEIAARRRGKFMASIPSDLAAREDNIAVNVVKENSSTKSKVWKLYLLADELMKLAAPHIACGRGCASCCKMNVMISVAEADRIGNTIGRKPANVVASRFHAGAEFVGVPCPFLNDDSCTIYQDRPLVCRTHSNFDKSAYWCAPDKMNDHEMPMVTFDGLRTALGKIAQTNALVVYADIRDFFDFTEYKSR
jgi:Fe-S-cluster containining protein